MDISGKVVATYSDENQNAFNETLGYVQFNVMDAETDSDTKANTTLIYDMARNIAGLFNGNTYMKTTVTYEVNLEDLDLEG